jgi:hypothetical protein
MKTPPQQGWNRTSDLSLKTKPNRLNEDETSESLLKSRPALFAQHPEQRSTTPGKPSRKKVKSGTLPGAGF